LCVTEELARTPKGTALVVDFVDFECPFCRMTQASFDPALDAEKGHVRLVRKMVPLTRIHPHALAAARAECCGELLGQGDAMADALFKANVDTLTPEGCKAIAASLGIAASAYDACITSPEVDARLARDRHDFDQAARKGDGLPLLWIGTRKLMGAQDPETLASALRDARAGS
jgi:protein-disulfide isomerase